MMNTVVDNWKVLRQRNIDNAKQAEGCEKSLGEVVGDVDKKQKSYARLQAALEKIPQLSQQISDMNEHMSTLTGSLSKLEIIHDKLVQLRNANTVNTYEAAYKKKLEAHRTSLHREFEAEKARVVAARERVLQQELRSRKEHFERELDQAMRQFAQGEQPQAGSKRDDAATASLADFTADDAAAAAAAVRSHTLTLSAPPLPDVPLRKVAPLPAEVASLVDRFYNEGRPMAPEEAARAASGEEEEEAEPRRKEEAEPRRKEEAEPRRKEEAAAPEHDLP
jgi:hypothetical protein